MAKTPVKKAPAKKPAKPAKWTMKSYCDSQYDKKEDAFGASLLGVSVAKFKAMPESKALDAIWVKLLNKAGKTP